MAKVPEIKKQAQEIMVAVDRDLQQIETQPAAMQEMVDSKVNSILDTIFGIINDVDIEAAGQRVQALKEQNPTASPEELTQILIREKSKRTGTVGAVTSGAGLIPGIGTAAAMTLGVAADIGATFKLQAELVLEIAAAYHYPLTETEKQRLVMLITGISVGTTSLTQKAGQVVALKVGEKLASRAAQKSFTKALPVVGVIASAGTNVLSTYIIGQRADAYFQHGPEAVGNWSDSLRAISGVDERKIVGWLAESSRTAGSALVVGAGKVGDAGKIAGEAISSGAGKVAESVGEGAQATSIVVRKGIRWYIWWVITVWSTIFWAIGQVLRFLWAVIAYVPRKIIGLTQRNSTKNKNGQGK